MQEAPHPHTNPHMHSDLTCHGPSALHRAMLSCPKQCAAHLRPCMLHRLSIAALSPHQAPTPAGILQLLHHPAISPLLASWPNHDGKLKESPYMQLVRASTHGTTTITFSRLPKDSPGVGSTLRPALHYLTSCKGKPLLVVQ